MLGGYLVKLITISGSAGVGKDTVATYIQLNSKKLAHIHNIIDDFKLFAKTKFFWDGEKTEHSRAFLADLKFVVSKYVPDYVIRFTNKKFERLIEPGEVLILMCREPRDMAILRDYYKYEMTSLYVVRPNTTIPYNDADKHVHECGYNDVIVNDGTLRDLEKKVKEWLKKIHLILY